MNRLLFYLNRQRIQNLNTFDTHPPEPDTSTLNSGNLSSKLHLDIGFPSNFALKLISLKESFTSVITVMRFALFWDFMLRMLVVRHRPFGRAYRSHFKWKN